jgi:hypothetical protein
MKSANLFPLVPALAALCLLAVPATGLSDHKIKVYQDRDGDGHYNKKTIDVGHRHYYGGGRGHYYGRPYGYYRPGYGYGYEPSVSFSVTRSYAPDYSDDLAVDVQRQLRRRGYYYGPIDGDVGPGTRSAIRAYQYDRGLVASGRIDRALLHSLGV